MAQHHYANVLLCLAKNQSQFVFQEAQRIYPFRF